MKKIKLKESKLIELIENTVKEELLLEKRVCKWYWRKGGSKCENRRRQKGWNCGIPWEGVHPSDDFACDGMLTNVGPGSDDDSFEREMTMDRLSERHIRRLLKKL